MFKTITLLEQGSSLLMMDLSMNNCGDSRYEVNGKQFQL
ncbi:hypothetical protein AC27_1998 [Escherichia coli 1-182-04_S3_C2]|nr:hypothetical protein AC56_2309 [Escherichia coli 1-182-04_S3_C3]EZJ85146.1 hypothetical protein AC27_1998 [Escherichia coli 1-182-04_S3_C2]EZJ96986.1 hypothetical protein AB99_2297 [Escherichia coli 1-182-04_S3_C1]